MTFAGYIENLINNQYIMKKTNFIIYNGFTASALIGRADVNTIYGRINHFSISIGNGCLNITKQDLNLMCKASPVNVINLHPSNTIFAEMFDDVDMFKKEVARLQEA